MIAPLWTTEDVAQALGVAAVGNWSAQSVSTDSRSLEKEALFVALRGGNFDGHAYVAAALEAGAVAAIVDHLPEGLGPDAPLVQVPDTLAALQQLGVAARQRRKAKFVGVTGSVGKTGTKDALARALNRSAPTWASERSLNNHIGVPLTLANMPEGCDYAVLEMGMNHAGELRQLTGIARPHIAVVTAITAAHTEFFDSLEDIADAKAEIFEGVVAGGTAILNRDDRFFDRLADRARACGIQNIISFGQSDKADVRALKVSLQDDCTAIMADVSGILLTYKVGVPGAHWVNNSLCVMAAVHALGADLGLAGLALAEMLPPVGRGRRHQIAVADGSLLLIDESYNANPASMKAAIAELGRITPELQHHHRGRRIAVIGEMRELGDASVAEHVALRDDLEAAQVDVVHVIGAGAQALYEKLPKGRRGLFAEALDHVAEGICLNVQPGDVIMVKGSNAVGLASLVDQLRARGDELTGAVGR